LRGRAAWSTRSLALGYVQTVPTPLLQIRKDSLKGIACSLLKIEVRGCNDINAAYATFSPRVYVVRGAAACLPRRQTLLRIAGVVGCIAVRLLGASPRLHYHGIRCWSGGLKRGKRLTLVSRRIAMQPRSSSLYFFIFSITAWWLA
jgi:hypothetical protein